MVIGIKPQIGNDVADLLQQAPVLEIKGHAGAGIVFDAAGVLYLLKIVEAHHLAGIVCIHGVTEVSFKAHRYLLIRAGMMIVWSNASYRNSVTAFDQENFTLTGYIRRNSWIPSGKTGKERARN
jgi:threonine dehydrogenase-like Zn-dependent dehydrogenase